MTDPGANGERIRGLVALVLAVTAGAVLVIVTVSAALNPEGVTAGTRELMGAAFGAIVGGLLTWLGGHRH